MSLQTLELLTLLNPNSIDPTKVQGDGNGKPTFTSEDVAGALRDLDDDEVNLLLSKYTGNTETLKSICSNTNTQDKEYYSLYLKVVDLFNFKGYRVKGDKKGKIRCLLNLCIIESMESPCPTCKGTKTYRYKPCKACTNHPGQLRLSNSQKAHAIGINRKNWTRWVKPYNEVTRLVQLCEETSKIKFKKALQGR